MLGCRKCRHVLSLISCLISLLSSGGLSRGICSSFESLESLQGAAYYISQISVQCSRGSFMHLQVQIVGEYKSYAGLYFCNHFHAIFMYVIKMLHRTNLKRTRLLLHMSMHYALKKKKKVSQQRKCKFHKCIVPSHHSLRFPSSLCIQLHLLDEM